MADGEVVAKAVVSHYQFGGTYVNWAPDSSGIVYLTEGWYAGVDEADSVLMSMSLTGETELLWQSEDWVRFNNYNYPDKSPFSFLDPETIVISAYDYDVEAKTVYFVDRHGIAENNHQYAQGTDLIYPSPYPGSDDSYSCEEYAVSPISGLVAYAYCSNNEGSVRICNANGECTDFKNGQPPPGMAGWGAPYELRWSDDGQRLAYIIPVSFYAKDQYWPNWRDKMVILEIGAGEKKYTDLLSGPASYPIRNSFEDTLQWMRDSVSIIGSDDQAAFVVDSNSGDLKYLPFSADDFVPEDIRLSPLGNYISVNSSQYSGTECASSDNIWTLSSLLNLSADLQISKGSDAVYMKGTAADLNFANWKLEYTDQNAPDEWALITPSTEIPVVNGLLGSWVPPYEGSFLVRLTVADKAGNIAWDRRVVTWGKRFSVTNIYKTGEHFSPNGDGVLDTIGLNYTVNDPVSFDLSVLDEAGTRIRTFRRDHFVPGQYSIVWDGRDESGGIVPDGYYSIRLFDYEFFFQVDTVPPVSTLEFTPVICEISEDPVLHTDLSGQAQDKNLKSWAVFYGEGETPQEWYDFKSGGIALDGSVQRFTPQTSPSISHVGNQTYKIVAEDFAGNKSFATAQYKEKILALFEWDGRRIDLRKNDNQGGCDSIALSPIRDLEPGIHNLKLAETLGNPIKLAIVQYQKQMQWFDAEEVVTPHQGILDLDFDTSVLNPGEITAVRVRAVDEADHVYYSNAVTFPNTLNASLSCFNPARTPHQHFNVSSQEELVTVKFQAKGSVAGGGEWKDLGEYTVDGFQYTLPVPEPEALPPGAEYPVRFVGIGVSGRMYISNELKYNEFKCSSSSLFCNTELHVSYSYQKATCNTPGNSTATIFLDYCPEDLNVWQDTIKFYLENNGQWELLKQVDPKIEPLDTRVTINTSDLLEGEHFVRADIVNGASVIHVPGKKPLVVDRTLPNAKITYPGSSVPFCAKTVVNEQGDIFQVGDIVGHVEDENGIAEYSLFYGQGVSPSKWEEINTCTPGHKLAGDCLDWDKDAKTLTGRLGGWNVTGLLPGERTLQLSATDKFGNTSCMATTVNIDRLNTSLTAGVGETVISPNGDGMKDVTSVEYQVEGSVVLDISVIQKNTLVRKLVTSQEISDGSGILSWDGRNDAGGIVPDGVYTVSVETQDSCQNLQRKMFAITVDNTPPTTMILSPGSGEPPSVMTSVVGTVTDTHFLSYQLFAKNETTGAEPVLLKQGNNPVQNDLLGYWNTSGLEGNWSLILTGEDSVGNTRTTILPISFGTRQELITRLDADPWLISPNNDGKSDASVITYEIADAADITLAIETPEGAPVLSADFPNTPAGSHGYQWSGLDVGGITVQDGTYLVKLEATSVAQPGTTQLEQVSLVSDTTPPVISITTPLDSSYYPGAITVQGIISDANLREHNVQLSDGQNTQPINTEIVGTEVRFSQTFNLDDGEYVLQVDAVDAVENSSTESVAFSVDTTRPRISLENPVAGDMFGGPTAEVSVTGVIEESNLALYSIQYGLGTNPDQWVELAAGSELPPDTLANWGVGPGQDIDDGDYTIRVTVEDKAGWQSFATVGIRIDNNAPELSLAPPPDEDGYVTGPLDIVGSVSDLFLQKYSLELADANCSATVNWSTLRTGTQPIQGDRLFALQTLPPDGEYCLRLSAEDAIGNTSAILRNFRIDTIPPAPPELSGSLEETNALLSWADNGESDLAGYNLYRNNEKINSVILTGTDFQDQGLEEGEYVYILRAVDLAGNESVDSNQVDFTVDLTPPDAMITSPRDTSQVSNYADILGRAYSEDDFKEYRVSYGIGQNPKAWHLLRKSPVPIPHGTLVRWDVLTLEDGFYSIKLEAEDLNGNVNEHTVTVTIDNTPPAAPVLLSATPTDAVVDLSWQANVEPDLAGYLVYRNGRLVNGVGAVIGDYSPYLITGLDFQDIEVPDGTHMYYLVAMDEAGNMSGQSNSIQVSIDTHPPHLEIIEPDAGLEFDAPIFVKADSTDNDIETVQFQYQRDGENVWINLGAVLSQRPYLVNFDPASLGYEYGFFSIRALATDLAGQADTMPEEVAIHFTDVTPPSIPTGQAAKVNGGFISLSWNPNSEPDLAGYNVYQWSGTPLNTTLVTDISYVDPPESTSGHYTGEYEFKITAVDAYGNESEPAPVTAIVFKPSLNHLPYQVNVADISVTGGTLPEATVEILRQQDSGDDSVGTVLADSSGEFVLSVSLQEMNNILYAVATDPDGNVSLPSYSRSVIYDKPPAAPTGLVADVDNYDVALSWLAGSETDLAGYNVYRQNGPDWQRINPGPVTVATYTDPGLKNDTYVYRVTAVDAAGGESDPSNESTAVVDQQIPTPATNLTAEAVPEGRAIHLCWNGSPDPVAGYHIYRSLTSGGPYGAVSSDVVAATCYPDSGLENGTEYFYIVRAVDSYGNESENSNEASAVPEDTVTPEKPVILLPTISGIPYHSRVDRANVTGLAEPGVQVDLVHDQVRVDTVTALNEQIFATYALSSYLGPETASTPDGSSIYYSKRDYSSYPYQLYTFKLDLASEIETRIDQVPAESTDYSLSPDGARMAYLYLDATGKSRIGVFDLGSGMAGPLLASQADIDVRSFSWSRDSGKIVFAGDGGDGFYNIWLHDLASGETFQVTQDMNGEYPEMSADNQNISFLSQDSVTGQQDLYLVDSVVGGTPVLLEADVYITGTSPSVEWSQMSNRIAYTANHDGFYDIFVYDSDTAQSGRLTNSQSIEQFLQWSPAGKHIAYHLISGSENEIRMVSADEGAEDLLLYSFWNWYGIESYFKWLPAGIVYRANTAFYKIVLPGTFTFNDVPLHAGENIFSAVARDAAGHSSEPADEITVQVDAESLPDLEVLDEDIFLVPGAPIAGEPTTVHVLARNRSSLPAENVYAEIYLWDANDNLALIYSETIPAFQPSSEQWLSVELDTSGLAGMNSIFVLLDPDGGITESVEDNNNASTGFYVSLEAGFSFNTELGANEFQSNEIVPIVIDLHNSTTQKTVSLSVAVEDANGVPVDELGDWSKTLSYGDSETIKLNWSAGSVFAGTYQVRTILSDDTGMIGEEVDPFTILPDIDVIPSITTDKAAYNPDEDVRFDLSVANSGANAILSDVQARLTVTDGNNALYTEEQTIASLWPESSVSLKSFWDTARHAPGGYTGLIEIYYANELVATTSTDFEILPVLAISGTVAADPQVVFRNGGVNVDFSMTSGGNVDAGPIQLQLVVLDTTSWATVASYEESISPDIGETVSGHHLFAGIPWDLGVYQVNLQYIRQGAAKVVASDSFLVRDGVAPEVTILAPAEGSVFSNTINIDVLATDDASGVAGVEYQVDGGIWLPLPLVDPVRQNYAGKWMPRETDEGPHTLLFRAKDNAGNRSLPVTASIVIRPRVDMATAIDKAAYGMNEDVAVGIELSNIAWQKLVHLTAQIETSEGALIATLADQDFFLTADEQLSLAYLWNSGAYSAGQYRVRAKIMKNGLVLTENLTSFEVEKVLVLNGTLALSSATVPFGETLTGAWSVDNNGNFDIAELTVDNILTDLTPAELQSWTETLALPKGQGTSGSFLVETENMPLGRYQVKLKARAETDNVDIALASFEVVDIAPPELSIISPAAGALVNGPIELSVSATDDASGVEGVEYRIDQQVWQPLFHADPAGNTYSALWTPEYNDEGVRTISFRGQDKSGNVSEPLTVAVSVELCNPFNDLKGSLDVYPDPLYYGQEAALAYTFTNQCTKPLNSLNARIIVLDPATDVVVIEKAMTVYLGPEGVSSGSVAISTLELDVRLYAVTLEIYTPESGARVLSEAVFEVLAAIEIENKFLDQTHLLVWLNNGRENCDDERDDEEHGGACEHQGDELHEHHANCSEGCASYIRLQEIIEPATDSATIVCSRDAFEFELRNSLYSDVLVIGDHQQLTDHYDEELREKVHSGTGLISFGWNVAGDHEQDDGEKEHDEVQKESFLGVKTLGTLSGQHHQLMLTESQISEVGKVEMEGKFIRIEAAGDTQVAGWFVEVDDDDCKRDAGWQKSKQSSSRGEDERREEEDNFPALVLHEYGLGRTVYAAFGLCDTWNDQNDDQLAYLLSKAVRFVHRADERTNDLVPYQIRPFALAVTSPGLDFNLTLRTTCPPELMLFDPAAGEWIEHYPWIVTVPILSGETVELPYYVLASDQLGAFPCTFDAGRFDESRYTFLHSYINEFAVTKDRVDRLTEAIGDINELAVSRRERGLKRNAVKYLRNILERTESNRKNTEKNIHDIEKAVNSLLGIESVDITDIRLSLDTLLRLEQGRLYFYE